MTSDPVPAIVMLPAPGVQVMALAAVVSTQVGKQPVVMQAFVAVPDPPESVTAPLPGIPLQLLTRIAVRVVPLVTLTPVAPTRATPVPL